MAKRIITMEMGRPPCSAGPAGRRRRGKLEKGRLNLKGALGAGKVVLADIDDIAPDAVLVTGSAVGAPPRLRPGWSRGLRQGGGDTERERRPRPGGFHPQRVRRKLHHQRVGPGGPHGLPVVDALCNGRAHPTGTMGSMGLHRDPAYVSRQAAAGGDRDKGMYLEIHAAGGLAAASSMVRAAADRAGGLVAVARNPVKASYVKKYGACGSLARAMELGKRMKEAMPGGGRA